jgi:glucosamine--fructose-6-phosphate aminotransferase (isomerizing)
MEVTRTPALGYSAADLAHGPVTILRERTPAIVVQSAGPAAHSVAAAATDLSARGADVFRIGSAVAASRSHHQFSLPVTDWRMDPVAAMVPLQLIAHGLATRLGRDPDAPAGLSKVTLTV